mmetsp:Transcript_11743/g.32528  ORF Transcript_11743/g.32528 Transcript_11743/m.32528 type:complete len:214 (-) Transcript_11743:56-697(-)
MEATVASERTKVKVRLEIEQSMLLLPLSSTVCSSCSSSSNVLATALGVDVVFRNLTPWQSISSNWTSAFCNAPLTVVPVLSLNKKTRFVVPGRGGGQASSKLSSYSSLSSRVSPPQSSSTRSIVKRSSSSSMSSNASNAVSSCHSDAASSCSIPLYSSSPALSVPSAFAPNSDDDGILENEEWVTISPRHGSLLTLPCRCLVTIEKACTSPDD